MFVVINSSASFKTQIFFFYTLDFYTLDVITNRVTKSLAGKVGLLQECLLVTGSANTCFFCFLCFQDDSCCRLLAVG